MLENIKVGLGQIKVIPGRPDLNMKTIIDAMGEARSKGADIAVFPEMAIPGYMLGDLWEQRAFLKDCEYYGAEVVKASTGITVLFGNVAVDWEKTGDDGRVRKYNAFFAAQDRLLWDDGRFPYPYRIKTLHPNYRGFEDTRHFYSMRKLAVEIGSPLKELLRPISLRIRGEQVNLGCILCEDGWSDDYSFEPIRAMRENSPIDLFINISSSPFTLGKNGKRNRVFSKQAREMGVPVVYVNNVGIQNNGKTIYTFDGGSAVYDNTGTVVAGSESFSPCMDIVDIALETSKSPENGGGASPLQRADDDIDAIYKAVSYGIGCFLESIGMKRVVVGASGGVDSAVAAALYVKLLGPDNVLLINMPSVYNSETTKGLALQLAKNLGCLYTVIPIQDSVDHTIKQIEGASVVSPGGAGKLKLSGFMKENIQARDRSARILAAAAAAFGCGFTCNANKAETTVGYSTLYGDQAGFLAALGDLWKHQVYDLARYLNRVVYGREVIPQGIIDIVPSAELSDDQAVDKGKGDPIIYPYHDYLFRAFIEHWDRATPEDILKWYISGELEERLGCEKGLVGRIFKTAGDFVTDLERWWNQYMGMGVAKRIQAPPILAVSRRAFGFDHREAQNGPYYTHGYLTMKEKLLSGGE